MATNRSRKQVRESRALGLALTPKAVRYFEKRPYGPGEHGRTRRRQDSDYAVRLKEKQRLRAQYGIRESQLRRAFEEARRTAGLTGENLVELLEMRLDALVLRAGFARTIQQARQVVVHRHVLVDGKIVDRPSFRVKPGQTIQVKPEGDPCASPQARRGPRDRRRADGRRALLALTFVITAPPSTSLGARLYMYPTERLSVPMCRDGWGPTTIRHYAYF